MACEPSGDLLGGLLLEDFLPLCPKAKIAGVCGEQMRKFPIENILDSESLSVMGFVDVAFSFLRLSRLFFKVKKEILRRNPKVVVMIDAPSFNLKMAKALKKAGYKGTIIQYVCPTIWAWKKHRKKTMPKVLDILVPLFPFEKNLFESTSLKTYFFGHPLRNKITPYTRVGEGEYITLFPGSRSSVIAKNLPLQLWAAEKLSKEFDLPLQIVAAHEKAAEQISRLAPSCAIVPSYLRYEAMQNSRIALATSGTVTLELALCKVPTIVNYVIRPFDEWLARKVFKINLPFFCIVNLLMRKEVFPEYFGSNLTQEIFLRKAQEILLKQEERQQITLGCHEVLKILNVENEKRFADLIFSLLDESS